MVEPLFGINVGGVDLIKLLCVIDVLGVVVEGAVREFGLIALLIRPCECLGASSIEVAAAVGGRDEGHEPVGNPVRTTGRGTAQLRQGQDRPDLGLRHLLLLLTCQTCSFEHHPSCNSFGEVDLVLGHLA